MVGTKSTKSASQTASFEKSRRQSSNKSKLGSIIEKADTEHNIKSIELNEIININSPD